MKAYVCRCFAGMINHANNLKGLLCWTAYVTNEKKYTTPV